MFPTLRLFISNQIKDEKGIALIVIVFMLWFLGIAAISEMLATTGTQLSQTNLEIALLWADQTAVETTSPIRTAIDKQLHSYLQRALKDHLQKDSSAKENKQSYVCRGIVAQGYPLNRQMSICDPVR